MNAEEVFDQLAAEHRESQADWSTASDQARSDWGNEPQVSAILDYLDGLSASDRDSALTGSTYETLKSWIRSGVFLEGAAPETSDEDDGYESDGMGPEVGAYATEWDSTNSEGDDDPTAWTNPSTENRAYVTDQVMISPTDDQIWQEFGGQEAPITAETGESSTVLDAFAELTEEEFEQLISDGFVRVEEVEV